MIHNTKVDSLPCPRLEMRWTKAGDTWAVKECRYALVIPLGWTLEMRVTKITGGKKPIFDDHIDTPYGQHARSVLDQDLLGRGVPRVAVCGSQCANSLRITSGVPRVAVCGDLWSYVTNGPDARWMD